MVQKRSGAPSGPNSTEALPKKRGRPLAFEPEAALARAIDVFRDGGYAATSLDDLSAAMGINRPSLYGAFGDKRDLFLKAFARYRADVSAEFAKAFEPALTLREALETIFVTALDVYLAGEKGPRGCFTVMTIGSEAMADPEIREIAQRAVTLTEAAVTKLFARAVARGELAPDADTALFVQLVASAIHTIAIRSRAGFPRAELEQICGRVVDLICANAIDIPAARRV